MAEALSTFLDNPLILGAQKWSGRISVSGEAGWVGETRTATPKNSQDVPYYYSKRPELFAVDTTG